jgi:hypothetical protein
MNRKSIVGIAAFALLSGAGTVMAQDDGTDATMTLMEHLTDKLPDAVINDVSLPEHLMSDEGEDPTAAETNSHDGLEKANVNRQHRLGGLGTADAASAGGFEMRESAMENRENMGRSDEHRPEDPPEPPEPPQDPPGGPPGGG